MERISASHRYDIDYIRVLAFAILILYHVCVFFEPAGWHIKNNVTYRGILYPMIFVNQWRLPLLFVVSGMGTWFALGRRSGWQYATERFRRLFIPLVIGILFIVPPQVYVERLSQGFDYGGYFHFWPAKAFCGIYPQGNFSWHHLWFILYLFVYSLVLLPVFLPIRKKPEAGFSRAFDRLCKSPVGLLSVALPFVILRLLHSCNVIGGEIFEHLNYAVLFFVGFMLVKTEDIFWNTVCRYRYIYLGFGVVTYILAILLWFGHIPDFALRGLAIDLVRSINPWIWILVVFGFCCRHLNRPGRGLAYANEAVYPFYILHQTVMVILGYYIRNWNAGFLIKFTAMAGLTFFITWVIYEYGIRRHRLIRPLFGMKNK